MKYIFLFIIISFSSLLLISCSDLKENIPTANSNLNIHEDGIIDPASPNFHGALVAKENWNFSKCKQCHSANYSGGITGASCLNCHNGPGGPEACNTCHGSFAFPTKIAPPRSLNGSMETTTPGVGAHTSHLYENTLGKEILCSTCHKIPQYVSADGHIGDDNKAELTFSGLSMHGGVNPQYNFSTNTCSDTYCHGNFVSYKDSSAYAFVYTATTITGNNASVKWNKVDGTQAECGSCHGLPPVGHIASEITNCASCHIGIVNAQGEIIDAAKHINGVINVFNN